MQSMKKRRGPRKADERDNDKHPRIGPREDHQQNVYSSSSSSSSSIASPPALKASIFFSMFSLRWAYVRR